MKTLTLIGLMIASSVALADRFVFQDVDGYKKCLANTDGMIESENTASGRQHTYTDADNVRIRCMDAAAKLIANGKNRALGMEILKVTREEANPESALDIARAVVNISRPTCNEMAVYQVITKALSFPKQKFPRSFRERSEVVEISAA